MKNKVYANFNELVFEDRNRFYGAYVLRKQYEDNLLVGLLLGTMLVGTIVAIPYVRELFRGDTSAVSLPKDEITHEISVVPDDEPIILPQETKPQTQEELTVATREFTRFRLADDATHITTLEELDGIQPGTENVDGILGLNLPPANNNNNIIIGEGDGDKDPVEFIRIEKKPEFPGGEKAMYEYFGKSIKYPDAAKVANITGTVYVSFVIDEFGGIRNVKLLRGIGGGCDEEAMRVIREMPRWSPGKQAGRPVKVSYQLPVRFDLL